MEIYGFKDAETAKRLRTIAGIPLLEPETVLKDDVRSILVVSPAAGIEPSRSILNPADGDVVPVGYV